MPHGTVGGVLRPHRTGAMHDPVYGLPGIYLLGNRVNKRALKPDTAWTNRHWLVDSRLLLSGAA
jgi:hypothetical protein